MLFCFPFVSGGVLSEPTSPIRFAELQVTRESAPIFPLTLATDPVAKGITHGKRLEDQDLDARAKKHFRMAQEVWSLDAGSPEGATLTVIYDLVEKGGLSFEFTADVTGTFFVEVQAPRAPFGGPYSVRIGDRIAGVTDPWAPAPEVSTWRRFPKPVEVVLGENRIDLIQLSPTDSPLYLRSFRLVPPDETAPLAPSDSARSPSPTELNEKTSGK